MAVKLETLELEIVQSIKSSRSKALDSLEKRLRGLRDALNGFQDADEAVHIIQRISNVTHTLGTAVDSTSKMASALRRLNNATTDMSTAGQNVRNISAAFRDLSNASNFIDGESLQRIVDATGQMSASGRNLGAFSRGLNSVGKDTDAIGQTVERFQTFVNTLSEAGDAIDPEPLEKIAGVSQVIGTAGNSLNRFARGINALGTSMLEVEVTANRFEKFIYGINDASKAVDTAALAPITEFAKTVGSVGSRLEKFVAALEKLSKFGANSEQLKQALQGIDAIVGRLAQHKAELDALAETLNNVSASLKTLNRAGDVGAQIQRVQKSLKTAGSDAAAFARHLVKMPWEHLKNKIGGLVKPLQNLVHSFARIAMYRALRTAIKAITQGFSEGIKHLYHWSSLVDSEFKASMDSLSTSAHYLRDSLGAMASPLIDAVAPAIEALTEKFVALLNVVNQFMAALTGKDTWRKAVRTPTTYSGAMKEAADNTRKATKAQKELNKALQGFDELNLITTSEIKARKPSSSTGKEPEVTSEEFEVKPVADWIQAIKKAIEDGDWAGAGTLLAEKLNGLVEDWKAKEFGNKLGEKFQKGLDFYLAFMKKFEWEDLGTKIGQMFNGIFETMNAEDLGHALVAHIKAAVKLAKGFLKEAEPTFQALGVAVSTAINDLFDKDFADELGETLGTAVKDAITFLKTLIVGSEKILQNYDTGETITVKVGGIDFKQVGESLMTAIFTAIKTINWADLGETMAGLFTGIIDAIGAGISYAAEHISEIAGAIKDFAVAFFSRMWEWFWPTVFQFLTGGEGYTYQGGGGNDRPNAPTSTGAGATTLPEFNTEMKGMTDGLTEAWKYLEEHNPLNLNVTDTNGTIKAQEKSVEGLNLDLDHTNGTFTSNFATKNLADRQKAVKPYWQKVTSLDDTLTSKFKTKDLADRKKAVNPYWEKVTGLAKTITTKFATSNLESTKKDVASLQKALDDLAKQKNIKVKMTVDVANAGTSQQHLQVNNYFGTRLIAEAEGGFPPQGSMFVAGEVPGEAEMVGNINGRTGVASGKEITGIADAVRDTGQTEAELLREQNNLLRRLLTKTGTVTLAPSAAAGRWVNQSQAAYARATGG